MPQYQMYTDILRVFYFKKRSICEVLKIAKIDYTKHRFTMRTRNLLDFLECKQGFP